MNSPRNTPRLSQSRLPEQALSLPRTLAAAVARGASSTEAADGVERINLLLCNAYLVGEPRCGDRGWALVDAGVSIGAPAIMAAAERRFGARSRPAAIILTHGHFDHVGGLPRLSDSWDAPVYCHPLEAPYVTGRSAYPPADPSVGGGAMTWLSRFFPRGPFDFSPRVQMLPPDGTVPGMPGWRWIATPGHTPGHVSLWREADRTLIAGDAFVNTRQESLLAILRQQGVVSRPPAYYTPDWNAARGSVERLANLHPETAVTGHGPAMYGDELRRGLAHLLSQWEQAAVPEGGRYSKQSAVADDQGVRSVPPATMKHRLQTAAAIGLVAMVAAALLRRRRS